MFVLAIIIAIPEENDRFATMNRIAPGLEVWTTYLYGKRISCDYLNIQHCHWIVILIKD